MGRSLQCWAIVIALMLPMSQAQALIIKPPLDSQTYDALRSEVMERIPTYAPEWTDHNIHDPGITMLELFAFTINDIGYRFESDLGHLLWDTFDPEDAKSVDALAYVLLDAGYRVRFGKDLVGDDWLAELGINEQWTYNDLVVAARQVVPEPGTLLLLCFGLLGLGFARRRTRS